MPPDYDALAVEAMDAADALLAHPGPLAHAGEHVDALLGAGQEVLVHYAAAKRAALDAYDSSWTETKEQALRERLAWIAEQRALLGEVFFFPGGPGGLSHDNR